MACTFSRQSTERLPLVTVAKAKLTALNTQCTVLGKGMLIPPKRVMYCIHRVSPWQDICSINTCSRVKLVDFVSKGQQLSTVAITVCP